MFSLLKHIIKTIVKHKISYAMKEIKIYTCVVSCAFTIRRGILHKFHSWCIPSNSPKFRPFFSFPHHLASQTHVTTMRFSHYLDTIQFLNKFQSMKLKTCLVISKLPLKTSTMIMLTLVWKVVQKFYCYQNWTFWNYFPWAHNVNIQHNHHVSQHTHNIIWTLHISLCSMT